MTAEEKFIRVQTTTIMVLLVCFSVWVSIVGWWVNARLSTTPAEVRESISTMHSDMESHFAQVEFLLDGNDGREYPPRLQKLLEAIEANAAKIDALHLAE